MLLTSAQREQFEQDGYLVVKNLLSGDELNALNEDFVRWREESCAHAQAYGDTFDHRPRFDVGSDHSPQSPSLRRVASPTEISDAYYKIAIDSRMTDAAFELIGSAGLKLHHSKVNAKHPNTETSVKWHQDFPFTPHSNDDLVTALLMLGDVTEGNGPLQVIPGSHKGTLYSHWQQDRFTGAVEDSVVTRECQAPVSCVGPAGSVCFMHTRLLHASAPNASDVPRTLFIAVYAAEDALPFSENPLPSRHQGQLVRGNDTGTVRSTPNSLRLPQKPEGASFFVQQAAQSAMS